MTRMQRNLWLGATVAFAVCLTVAALSYIVREPWRILPDIGGDGAKNNLTYLYHSTLGSGYIFSGMNYPYGEHIVFTDGIPLLSVFFASIGNVSVHTALAVLWWLVGLSYVLSVVYVYKTLLRFHIVPLYAMVFAGLISILTPQMICLRGHYAMAFTCIIPMLFYWSLAYHERRGIKYCAYVFIMGCLAAFLHPYYAGLILIWVAAYSFWYLVLHRDTIAHKVKHLAPFFLAGAAVSAVVMATIRLTDHATDRPQTPYAPIESYTNLPQVITSYFSPFWKLLVDKGIFNRVSDGGEGYSYLGLVSLAVLSLTMLWVLYSKLTKGKKPAPVLPQFDRIWVYIAVSVLVFSMGIPFVWHMQWLMDYLFIFKQFRALGRFAWLFYYVISVYAVVVMYTWFRALQAAGRGTVAWTLLCIATAIWGLEARGYMKTTRRISEDGAYNYDMIYSTYEQNWKDFLKEHKHSGSDFQALLLLPFFHVGTEKIWLGDPGWMMTLSSKAALQLHLPIIDVMMSRSSWSQAQAQVKTSAGPYADKPLLRDIKSDKPFLLLINNMNGLSPDEAYLLSACDYIGEHNECKVYACYPTRIAAADKQHAAALDSTIAAMPAGTDTCINCSGTWYTAHYDGGHEHGLSGGALPAIRGNDSIIASIPVTIAADSAAYEFSCWFLLRREDYRSPEVLLHMLNATGATLRTQKVRTAESTDSRDLWFRSSKYFYIPAACKMIQCQLVNTPNPTYVAIDELTLRPAAGTTISKARDGSIMANDHFLNPKK